MPGEIEQHAQTDEAVEWTHDAQVARPHRQHPWVGAEEADPRVREHGGQKTDRLSHAGREERGRPGDPPRPIEVAGADIGADHGYGRSA